MAPSHFDLVVRGGRIVDLEAGTIDVGDIGVVDGRIAAIEASLDRATASSDIDAHGDIVCPGLIDLHAHVNWRTAPTAIDADTHSATSGVTTWVDAGSANATNIEALREHVVERSQVRVLSMLRLEHPSPDSVSPVAHATSDPALLASVASRHRDIVVGLKVSMGQCEMTPLLLASRAAELAELPLMVHIAQEPPTAREVLTHLRAGDIVTHAFTGQTMRLVDEHGHVLEEALSARARGVSFDLGHGAGSFSWASAERLVAAGFFPDTISTDAWQVSVGGPMFDLPTCMSKMLHLGMSLIEVIRAVTSRPAELVGRSGDVGRLRVGAAADIAILRIESGTYPLYDTDGHSREATRLIRVSDTLVGGRTLEAADAPPLADWLAYAMSHDGHDPNPTGGVRPAVLALQEQLRQRGHTPASMAARSRSS